MKKTTLMVLAITLSITLFGQSKFETAVKNALSEFDSSKTADDMKAVAAKFERISVARPEQWLPRYYSSYIYCIMAFRDSIPEMKKTYTDYAREQLAEAMKIAPEESEIYTLQGMIYQAIIGIDPMNNGQVYSEKAAGAFGMAIKLDPANPRPYYLQGISTMYTPEKYGGGKKAALKYLSKASELFAAFKPASDISPNWGKDDCARYLAICEKN